MGGITSRVMHNFISVQKASLWTQGGVTTFFQKAAKNQRHCPALFSQGKWDNLKALGSCSRSQGLLWEFALALLTSRGNIKVFHWIEWNSLLSLWHGLTQTIPLLNSIHLWKLSTDLKRFGSRYSVVPFITFSARFPDFPIPLLSPPLFPYKYYSSFLH